MSDFTEYYEFYKKAWERSLSERTTELQEEIKTLRAENDMYLEALENIACGNVPAGSDNRMIPYTRWYQDYADDVLRKAKK